MHDIIQQRYPAGVLDSQVSEFLKKLEQEEAEPLSNLTPREVREDSNQTIIEEWQTKSPDQVATIKNSSFPGPTGDVPIRIYTPEGSGPFPILLFIHGGGWVICNLDTHDPLCRAFSRRAGCVVVSVDYRLAPEHKYPAAVEDVYAAALWVAQNAESLHGDPARIAVAGDSAGGNLSAALTLMARDKGAPDLVCQLLIYPVTNAYALDTQSYHNYAEGYMLLRDDMIWYRDHYLQRLDDGKAPYASPLLCDDLSGLPPAHVMTAEFDVLRDEGEAYAQRLYQAGNEVTCVRYNGLIHGFMSMDGILSKADEAITDAANFLRSRYTYQ